MDILRIALRVVSTPKAPASKDLRVHIGTLDLLAAAIKIADGKTSIIKKTPGKQEWCVKSKGNPDWSGGCYDSKSGADDRLEQVEAAKHAKHAAEGDDSWNTSDSKEAGLPPGRVPPMGKYDRTFVRQPARPQPGPYRGDDEAKKTLPKPTPPMKLPSGRKPGDKPEAQDDGDEGMAERLLKRPVKEQKRTERQRDRMDDAYENIEAFVDSLGDMDDEFDREDLLHLNFRTQTPIQKIKRELEGLGLKHVEHQNKQKPRGVADNPHGTSPFKDMSGGGAYDSIMMSKYGENPFEVDRGHKPEKTFHKPFDKE